MKATIRALAFGTLFILAVGLWLNGKQIESTESMPFVVTAYDYDSNDWPLPSLEQIQRRCGVKPDGIYGNITKTAWDTAICNQYTVKYFPKEKDMNKYVISWKSKVTGKTGCGKFKYKLRVAKQICNQMNAQYPNLEHTPKRAGGSNYEMLQIL